MFKQIFRILGDVARHPVQIGHIDYTEAAIQTITVNMCKKQALGK